jgi:hypothetical protein
MFKVGLSNFKICQVANKCGKHIQWIQRMGAVRSEASIQLFPIVCGEPGGAIYQLSQPHDGELTSYNWNKW